MAIRLCGMAVRLCSMAACLYRMAIRLCGMAACLCGMAIRLCGMAACRCGMAACLCGMAACLCGMAVRLCGMAVRLCGMAVRLCAMTVGLSFPRSPVGMQILALIARAVCIPTPECGNEGGRNRSRERKRRTAPYRICVNHGPARFSRQQTALLPIRIQLTARSTLPLNPRDLFATNSLTTDPVCFFEYLIPKKSSRYRD